MKKDPSRTQIRRRASSETNRRFRELKRVVIQTVFKNNALGLVDNAEAADASRFIAGSRTHG